MKRQRHKWKTGAATGEGTHGRLSLARIGFLLGVVWLGGGCATIRVTDPARTATEQFLLTGAVARAVEQLSANELRDRIVWVENNTLVPGQSNQEATYMVAEVRARLLESGVRLTSRRESAEVILEIRSGGIGIDRLEFLLGIPATYVPTLTGSVGTGAPPVATPELSILKTTRQRGFASVAFVAYWADSGELLATSGPFVGRTIREDYWIFGTGPRTVGNIPPTERAR